MYHKVIINSILDHKKGITRDKAGFSPSKIIAAGLEKSRVTELRSDWRLLPHTDISAVSSEILTNPCENGRLFTEDIRAACVRNALQTQSWLWEPPFVYGCSGGCKPQKPGRRHLQGN